VVPGAKAAEIDRHARSWHPKRYKAI